MFTNACLGVEEMANRFDDAWLPACIDAHFATRYVIDEPTTARAARSVRGYTRGRLFIDVR